MAKSNDLDSDVKRQHEQIGIKTDSPPTTDYQRTQHPDAQWYPKAGLGMFIHWGISSVLGQYDLSWGMIAKKKGPDRPVIEKYGLPAHQVIVPPSKYWAQAEKFLPDRYDPNKWLSTAKEVGFKYAVLTTKHHDGFALWPSEYGGLNTKNYMRGKDLVGEFVQACRNNGIKIGFYYSPPDWYFHRNVMSFNYGDTKPDLDINHEPTTLPVMSGAEKKSFDDGYRKYLRGQVTELLTRYGKIDLLWFDGRLPENTISMEEIRELQPGMVINPRGHGYGDFETPECKFPEKRPEGWWEYCHVFADGAWGYLSHEIYKPMGWFLAEYGKARAWGGNFLPNVAPDSHGELPEPFYNRMNQLKDWMAHSAPSVAGNEPWEWPEKSNVPVTRNGKTLYAHIDWLFEEPVEIKDVDNPASVKLLRTGENVPYTYSASTLKIALPSVMQTTLTDVVEIVI